MKFILINNQRFWNDGTEAINAILTEPSAERALKNYCGMSASKFKNHWQRISLSDRGKMSVAFSTFEEHASYVNDPSDTIAMAPLIDSRAKIGKNTRLEKRRKVPMLPPTKFVIDEKLASNSRPPST